MPTPATAFADAAAKYGNVDSRDIEAVQNWFAEVLPTLPSEVIEQVLHDLLERDGEISERAVTPVYPKRAPLPSLGSSPHVDAPFFAEPWSRILRSIAVRLRKPR